MLPLAYQLFFDISVLRQQVPTPSQRLCGRFVPGKIKGHYFVPELPVIHSPAVFVLGKQQLGKQILARLSP
jgi:hypothetical protein